MSMFGTDRDVDAIAEYADPSVRVMSRRGLAGADLGAPRLQRLALQQVGQPRQCPAAVALSVACTGGILRLLRAAHPPAGATTVIVSAGLLHTAPQLAGLAAGVALLMVSAHFVNRALGVPAPRWAAPR